MKGRKGEGWKLERQWKWKIAVYIFPVFGFTTTVAGSRTWICISYAGAAMEVHCQKSELAVEDSIAEVLRHAPHRPGGPKYKVGLNGRNLNIE